MQAYFNSSCCRKVYYIQKAKPNSIKNGSSQNTETNASSSAEAEENRSVIDVDEEKRHLAMGVKRNRGDFEVGTVDAISEAVVEILMSGGPSTISHDNGVQFPGGIRLQLHHAGNFDFPCLTSSFEARSKQGVVSYSMEIYAQSGDVEDIFQVLLQMEMASFNLDAVDETYLAAMGGFLSSNPYLRRVSIGEDFLGKDQGLVRNVMKSSKSLSTMAFCTSMLPMELNDNTNEDQLLHEYLSHIHESQSLKTLDLSRVMDLTPVVIDGLVEGFAKPTTIKTLHMPDSAPYSLSRIDISKLACVLANNETLEQWNLDARSFQDSRSIDECAKLLKVNKCLKVLVLTPGPTESAIDPDAWISFGKALSQASALLYLDISGHELSRESWKAFGEGLRANSSLMTFKAAPAFYNKEKETDILLPVFEALRDNQTLCTLDLFGFDLSDSFASLKALESSLIENSTLESLAVRNNSMTDEGAAILGRSLPKMKGIEELNLSLHSCTSKGAQAFAEGMKHNYNIVSVNFGTWYKGYSTPSHVDPFGARGFEKDYHEIEYYARMNRKGRRCLGSNTPPVDPPLWSLLLAKAQKTKETSGNSTNFAPEDVRKKDWFAGDHDTNIDAVFYLLRDVMELPVDASEQQDVLNLPVDTNKQWDCGIIEI